MKTEFNVERVCDRVHLCIVDAPEELGEPLIEVHNGSIQVSFPEFRPMAVQPAGEEAVIAAAADTSLPAIEGIVGASGDAEGSGTVGNAAAAKPKRRGK